MKVHEEKLRGAVPLFMGCLDGRLSSRTFPAADHKQLFASTEFDVSV